MRRWPTFNRESGRQSLAPGSGFSRHVHCTAYAAVVLAGGYEEAGNSGRFFARPGDVLFHVMFDGHLNRVPRTGAQILNVPLLGRHLVPPALGKLADPDAVVRVAERDMRDAAQMLVTQAQEVPITPHAWADELRVAIDDDPGLRLEEWARMHGLAAETLSRGFRQLYGVTPASFRVEARARAAWRRIVCESTPLSAIALACGFADQAHMTRAVRVLSGATPSAWRRSLGGPPSNLFNMHAPATP